RKKKLQL
ncbi:uncharacterized protein NPIL_178041, partial [Nephila pilipes]